MAKETTVIAMLVVLVIYFILTGLPLFVLGFSFHKCLSYLSEKFRNSLFKRIFLPCITGSIFAIGGFFLHMAVFDPFSSKGSANAKLSLLISALNIIPIGILLFAWMLLAIDDRRRKKKTPNQENVADQALPEQQI